MGRGAANNALDQAKSIEANNTQLQAQQQQQNQALTQQYNAIATNPGYTPAQQSAITNAALGGLGSAYDSLTNNASLRAVSLQSYLDAPAGLRGRTSARRIADWCFEGAAMRPRRQCKPAATATGMPQRI